MEPVDMEKLKNIREYDENMSLKFVEKSLYTTILTSVAIMRTRIDVNELFIIHVRFADLPGASVSMIDSQHSAMNTAMRDNVSIISIIYSPRNSSLSMFVDSENKHRHIRHKIHVMSQ
jgi:hypothetical protein